MVRGLREGALLLLPSEPYDFLVYSPAYAAEIASSESRRALRTSQVRVESRRLPPASRRRGDVMYWNGNAWTVKTKLDKSGELVAVAEVSPTDVWAVGGLIKH
jgi:hypothetical protein